MKKSLYGLKQSGRNWNNLLHTYLINENFTQSLADPCVYVRTTEDERCVIVIVRVDDIIIATSDSNSLQSVKKSLKDRFKMTDLGVLKWFLGTEFQCSESSIKMNQTRYIEKILAKFKMTDCKPKPTPCVLGLDKVLVGEESPEMDDPRLYRAAEYIALANAVQEAKFLKQLCIDMRVSIGEGKAFIKIDNQGATNLAKNPIHHQRSKHIDIRYHFIREEVKEDRVSLEYVPTKENIADIFTKPASKENLEKFKDIILGKYIGP